MPISAEERRAPKMDSDQNPETCSRFYFQKVPAEGEGQEPAEGTGQWPAALSKGNRLDDHTGCWARGFWEGQ